MIDFNNPRRLDLGTAEGLRSWAEDRSAALWAASECWPACWGGQYQLEHMGDCASVEAVEAELPTSEDMDLYMCLRGALDGVLDVSLRNVAAHISDAGWIADAAQDYLNLNGGFFYTEIGPRDFDADTLSDLAMERPDLFEAADIEANPELARYAAEAALSRLAPERAGQRAAAAARLAEEGEYYLAASEMLAASNLAAYARNDSLRRQIAETVAEVARAEGVPASDLPELAVRAASEDALAHACADIAYRSDDFEERALADFGRVVETSWSEMVEFGEAGRPGARLAESEGIRPVAIDALAPAGSPAGRVR